MHTKFQIEFTLVDPEYGFLLQKKPVFDTLDRAREAINHYYEEFGCFGVIWKLTYDGSRLVEAHTVRNPEENYACACLK